MEDKALVKSSFSATINAHIEEVDIPPGALHCRAAITNPAPGSMLGGCNHGAGWPAHLDRWRKTGRKPVMDPYKIDKIHSTCTYSAPRPQVRLTDF